MNILVIGNGFDLAHNLPTGYKDFLRFTECFTEFKNFRSVIPNKLHEIKDTKDLQIFNYLIELFNKADTSKLHKNLIEEIDYLVANNVWIDHFKKINISQGWIDFEKEISNVVQTFDHLRGQVINDLKNKREGVRLTAHQSEILNPFLGQASSITSTETLDYWKNTLLNDLNKLIRCLEIYLADYIKNIEIKDKLPDIETLDIHAVLSFNYTDTYNMLYASDSNSNIDYDFVHGKANLNNSVETCNMVIGIDEYLEKHEQNSNTHYIQFKKFFQRIFKGTGCKYVEWLDRIKSNPTARYFPNESNIYILGHSLDATDKDILQTLISAENTKTTVFYHDSEALEKQIANLVEVITEEELIHRTGTKKLVFKKTMQT